MTDQDYPARLTELMLEPVRQVGELLARELDAAKEELRAIREQQDRLRARIEWLEDRA